MTLASLTINNVRNIKEAQISPANRINLIVGKNGCGKSSLLEAIFLLGRGKSFRTANLKDIIKFECDNFIINGETRLQSNVTSRLGIRVAKDNLEIKIDGERKKDRSELAKVLPTQLIYPGSFNLLEGGPGHRRKFLDHGLFHMEQSFLKIWKKYNRALKQRNALLKTASPNNVVPWNYELANYGGLLTDKRQQYLGQFENLFLKTASEFLPFDQYDFAFYQGWGKDKPLEQVLLEEVENDIRVGFTKNGPHRADFLVKVNGKEAKKFLSRGQMKILIFALQIAQVRLLNTVIPDSACILIDDLSSEFDDILKERVLKYLRKLKAQVFITATNLDMLGTTLDDRIVFHVEHGRFFTK